MTDIRQLPKDWRAAAEARREGLETAALQMCAVELEDGLAALDWKLKELQDTCQLAANTMTGNGAAFARSMQRELDNVLTGRLRLTK